MEGKIFNQLMKKIKKKQISYCSKKSIFPEIANQTEETKKHGQRFQMRKNAKNRDSFIQS